MQDPSLSRASTPRKLSIPTMLAFGIGPAAEGVKNQAFNVFLFFFYVQVVGLSGGMVAAALAIALAFDAVTDPMMGVLSDRTRSRWGRRHPYLFASALPLALSFIALFSPPAGLAQWGSFSWLLVFTILVRASITLFHVPFLALGAEMARDYNQRSFLFSIGTVFQFAGMALVSFIGYRYFFPTTELFDPGNLNPAGYTPFAIFFGAAMFVCVLICSLGTAKEIPHLQATPAPPAFGLRYLAREFSAVVSNRSFRLIFFGMLMSTFAIAIEAVMSPFIGLHFWGLTTEQVSLVGAATLFGLLIGFPVSIWLTRKLDKKLALVIPAVFVIFNANAAIVLRLLDVSWMPENGSDAVFILYILRYFLQGICLPIIFASFNSMFADIADEVELATGQRKEGIIYSLRSFANKFTAAMGAIVGGNLIDQIAFPKNASVGEVPADTIWWLGFFEGPATSVISFCGILFYLRYRIDRKRHAEIRAEIDRRQPNQEREARAPDAAAPQT